MLKCKLVAHCYLPRFLRKSNRENIPEEELRKRQVRVRLLHFYSAMNQNIKIYVAITMNVFIIFELLGGSDEEMRARLVRPKYRPVGYDCSINGKLLHSL